MVTGTNYFHELAQGLLAERVEVGGVSSLVQLMKIADVVEVNSSDKGIFSSTISLTTFSDTVFLDAIESASTYLSTSSKKFRDIKVFTSSVIAVVFYVVVIETN